MKKLNISLLQIDQSDNADLQKETIHNLCQQLSPKIALVILPEMFLIGAENAMNNPEEEEESLQFLLDLSIEYKKVFIGSAIVKDEDKNYNRAYVCYPNGMYVYYDKHHLFGQEKEILNPGEKHLIISINGWKLLILLCFDIRFPVWNRMNDTPYDAIIYMAQWPEKRIQAWDILLPARAVENVSYVIGVNRNSEKHYPGHSKVIDPLGSVVLDAKDNTGIFNYELNPTTLERAREEAPFLMHKDAFIIFNKEE